MSGTNAGRATVFLLVMALAGCGSSTSRPATVTAHSPAATTAKPTGESHQALIASMNTICTRANAGLHNLGETAADLEKALSVYRSGINRLEALTPSQTDRATFNRYLQAIKRQEGIIVRIIPLIRTGETESISTLMSLDNTYSQQRVTAAIDLGAEECGRPSG